MSEILKIDVNDYGLQSMKSEGGGTGNLQSKTATPSTSQQIITPDTGYDGLDKVTISGVTSSIDNNITSGNIKEGVSILSVNGSLKDTSDATAIAGDIALNKTAYVNNQKVTGSLSSLTSGQKYTNPLITNYTGGYLDVTWNANNKVILPGGTTFSVSNSNVATAANIQAGNIKSGETIFGVTGTYTGGGSFPPDWSQIGYNAPPQIILNDFNYSKEIADNWDSSLTSLNSIFNNNKTLKYMPLVDTSNVTNLNSTWSGSNVIEIPLLDTSKVQGWVTTFANCYNLTKIPPLSMAGATYGSSSMGIKQTFYYCSNLVDVPVLDVSNATVLDKMFGDCPKLSDESLNNIMQMCINSKVTSASYKTLKAVGLSSAQATKCQSLSNWTAFTAAGWTSGY